MLAGEKLRRVRWKCRRGMLELDILLSNFINMSFTNLTLGEQKVFEILLDQPDPILYRWLFGQELPEDKQFLSMIKLLQKF